MLLRLALLWLPLLHDVVMWWSFGQASCTQAWHALAWWDSHPPQVPHTLSASQRDTCRHPLWPDHCLVSKSCQGRCASEVVLF